MPELIEVEAYRVLAGSVVGRRIESVERLDPFGLRGIDAESVAQILAGVAVTGTDRVGKLLLLTTDGPVLGLRFGMTGRLLVDGQSAVAELEYGGRRDDPQWDRTVIRFADGGDLRVRDPRRLGRVELDPDLTRLGPDAASVDEAQLAVALGRSSAPLKARLLDQSRLAGLGNLLVDEMLWRAGLSPLQPAGGLGTGRVAGLAAGIRDTIADLSARGGSHTGDLHHARLPGGRCPRDGTSLVRSRVGGRTTYHCPRHQT